MDRCDDCNNLLKRDSGRCPQCDPKEEGNSCVICSHDSADYGRVIDGDYYCFVHADREREKEQEQ